MPTSKIKRKRQQPSLPCVISIAIFAFLGLCGATLIISTAINNAEKLNKARVSVEKKDVLSIFDFDVPSPVDGEAIPMRQFFNKEKSLYLVVNVASK